MIRTLRIDSLFIYNAIKNYLIANSYKCNYNFYINKLIHKSFAAFKIVPM